MLIDSHAHLDDEKFAGDLGEVIRHAREAGVERIVTVGAGIASCEKALALAATHPGFVSAAVGIDPHSADAVGDEDFDRLAELARDVRVVAIGETGLEYYYQTASHEGQKRAFERQIRLAVDADLPLVIHCRDAFEDCFAMLRAYRDPKLRGVAHCFTGSVADADAVVELGFYVSFSGILTFPKSADLRAVAAHVPMARILIETDCPCLAPQAKRGKRNEPAYVKYVAETLAEVRGMPVDEVARATTENTCRLFSL